MAKQVNHNMTIYDYTSTGSVTWGKIIEMTTVQGRIAISLQAYISSILGY